MTGKAQTVEQYLAALLADRRAAIQAVRQTILNNLDCDYEEGIQYVMITYHVPHLGFAKPAYQVRKVRIGCLTSERGARARGGRAWHRVSTRRNGWASRSWA